jgi:hypothetical protein
MIRSIASVLVGYATIALCTILTLVVLSTAAPNAFPAPGAATAPAVWALALLLVAGAVYMVAGGFATAKIARRSPVGHALTLGAILLAVGVLTIITAAGGPVPTWYRVAGALMGMPAAWIGGLLAARGAARISATR